MKLAAVDIGSSATRLQVSSVLLAAGQPKFKRLEYLRFPLRLGHDVFKHQRISAENEQRLIQLLKAFKILIDLYGVDDYMVCATSAFRDANNKQENKKLSSLEETPFGKRAALILPKIENCDEDDETILTPCISVWDEWNPVI